MASDEKVSEQTNLFLGMKERAQEEVVVHVLVVHNVSVVICIAVDTSEFV